MAAVFGVGSTDRIEATEVGDVSDLEEYLIQLGIWRPTYARDTISSQSSIRR